jgi:2-keto-4-pentenoate hydratase/2-oxohepta-3-ene-1,7-dioic acid hydratase in catechol pathway
MTVTKNALTIPGLPFDPLLCHSPLPRAYQWADGSAYVNHVELVRISS